MGKHHHARRGATRTHLTLKELRASYFSRLNQLGNDREALLKLIKEFFVDYFDLKIQISFDDLPAIIARRQLPRDIKEKIVRFTEYLIETEYSPANHVASFSAVEERFRKVIFLITMRSEQASGSGLRPLKAVTRRYLSPLRKIYHHFFLPEEASHELKRFLFLQKKCLGFAKSKQYGLAKKEYAAVLRHYQKLVPAAQETAYRHLQEAHRAVLLSIPHEAHLQKLLDKVPARITAKNRESWRSRYSEMVKHYQYVEESKKERYYDRLQRLRKVLAS
ncbi:MAG: hypothetical protein GXP63_02755 [DPANN group archaeon]|nr:hypothetical protein [DPANN group archaeon]